MRFRGVEYCLTQTISTETAILHPDPEEKPGREMDLSMNVLTRIMESAN